jgi:hypothetical protein
LVFDDEVLSVRGPEEASLVQALREATYPTVDAAIRQLVRQIIAFVESPAFVEVGEEARASSVRAGKQHWMWWFYKIVLALITGKILTHTLSRHGGKNE